MKWKCKICGEIIKEDVKDGNWFDDYGEEMLWGHIQMRHKNEFEEVRDMETPDMLDECYDKMEVSLCKKQFKNYFQTGKI